MRVRGLNDYSSRLVNMNHEKKRKENSQSGYCREEPSEDISGSGSIQGGDTRDSLPRR